MSFTSFCITIQRIADCYKPCNSGKYQAGTPTEENCQPICFLDWTRVLCKQDLHYNL